jgi:hypothetical protein
MPVYEGLLLMNDQAIEKHSVNCYFCGELVDERECVPADKHNGGDGGDCCALCLARREVLFESVSLVRGNLKVEWEWIGEGNDGDYDPADKEDEPLLRFSCSRRELVQLTGEDDWEQLDDGSYCTQLPVTTPVSHLVRAALSILEAAEQPSPKRRFEELSWLNPGDFPTDEDFEKVNQGIMNAQGAYNALMAVGADKELPGYEGCVKRLDEAVGALERLRRAI